MTEEKYSAASRAVAAGVIRKHLESLAQDMGVPYRSFYCGLVAGSGGTVDAWFFWVFASCFAYSLFGVIFNSMLFSGFVFALIWVFAWYSKVRGLSYFRPIPHWISMKYKINPFFGAIANEVDILFAGSDPDFAIQRAIVSCAHGEPIHDDVLCNALYDLQIQLDIVTERGMDPGELVFRTVPDEYRRLLKEAA